MNENSFSNQGLGFCGYRLQQKFATGHATLGRAFLFKNLVTIRPLVLILSASFFFFLVYKISINDP